MTNIVFVTGAPCSGKSTYIHTILGDNPHEWISMGRIAKELSEAEGKTIEETCPAPSYLCIYENRLRDKMMEKIMTRIFVNGDELVVIDGFPRNAEQYEYLVKQHALRNKDGKQKWSIVIMDNLVGSETLQKRMKLRDRKTDTIERILVGIRDVHLMEDHIYLSQRVNPFTLINLKMTCPQKAYK